ncbi:MAG: CopG family transcriptional regulator [Clostridiales bacterium 43-6]|nr:MAG: CopG family transcriptional regulator [Clostridiales bacterium 43-6]
MSDKLILSKKDRQKGYDGYRTFSVRIKEELVSELDDLAIKTNRSRNELINIFIDFAVKNCEVDGKK